MKVNILISSCVCSIILVKLKLAEVARKQKQTLSTIQPLLNFVWVYQICKFKFISSTTGH